MTKSAPEALNVTRGSRLATASDEMSPRGDALVAVIAARQHAVVSSAQLAAAGITSKGIGHRVRHGRLNRWHRGVYLVGPIEAARTAEMAALLACGIERYALSHGSAAALWGLRPRPSAVEVTVTKQLRPRAGLRIHRTAHLDPAHVTTRHGLRLTTPARTLLDLAGHLPPHELERAVNEAQVQRLVTAHELHLLAGRSRALDAALTLEPALTRSEAESQLLALIRAARLPRPRANARVGRHEVDFLWPEQRLIVEVDGFAYHSSRAAFERDRARDAELQAAGYRVIRITWRQLTTEPEAVIARLAAALVFAASA